MSTFDERMAIRNSATMVKAQSAYDDMAEPEGDELVDTIREAIRLCDNYTGRAERALDRGDIDAAQDLLASAIKELSEVATVEEE